MPLRSTLRALSFALVTLGALFAAAAPASPASPSARVQLGIDVLLSDNPDLLADQRVGLLTHDAAVDTKLVRTADRLHAHPKVRLLQLWAPEHGLHGDLPAGVRVADGTDKATGLPVEGVYSRRRKPSRKSLRRIDTLVVDLQSIGSRTYTYISSLGEAMKAACRAKKRVVVLDRPNPLGGLLVQGRVRSRRRRSFIGWGPLPVVHGMTIGELARFYAGELRIRCRLEVVPMKGWRRDMVWQDTGLRWLPPSPHIPTVQAAQLYVATGMVASITRNVGEGVGTPSPFSAVVAAFLDGPSFAAALTKRRLPGVRFLPTVQRAFYGKLKRSKVAGVRLVVTDPHRFKPLSTALAILTTLHDRHGKRIRWYGAAHIGRRWGYDRFIRQLRRGRAAEAIERSWTKSLASFTERRAKYLLY